jgi:16S rRNA (guanine966-N2)-methyltransferase|tara:strand:+ start:522 stop:1082 length:561 start_codon:yes stop_codon:yes gene_type:complete
MRIISGSFKGKKILEPKNQVTRPLKDLTKESIFNIIIHTKKFNIELSNSKVLDLFSGVGSFGLECLSRGSSNLIFVESYKEVLPVLKRNITSINCQENSVIYEKDIIKNFDFKIIKDKIDIIFMDPPYKEKSISQLLTKIDESKILSSNGIIIIHRHKKEEDLFPENFNIIEKKSYGISKVIFGCF